MKSKITVIILLITLIGLALRLWLLLVTDSHSTDGIAFLSTAEYLRDPSAWDYTPKRITMPFYPFLVYVLSYLTGGDVVTAGRLLNTLIGTCIIPLIFIITNRLFNLRAAIIASVLASFDWFLIVYSTYDRADILFTLLTLILVWLFWVIPWEKIDYRNALLIGFITGLAHLTRTNGVLYIPVFVMLWIIYAVRNRIAVAALILKTLIPALIVFIAMASIPVIYITLTSAEPQSYIGHAFLEGTFSAIGEREERAYRLNHDATDYEISEQIESFSLADIWKHTNLIFEKYRYAGEFITEYFVRSVKKYFGWGLLVVIPLLLLFFAKRSEISGWSRAGYLLLFVTPYFLLMPLMQLQESYFVPLWPIFIMLFSWFLSEISQLKLLKSGGIAIVIMIMLSVITINVYRLNEFREREMAYPNGYRLVGEFLNDIKEPGEKVMSRDNTVYFYSKMRGYRPPVENLDRTIEFCRNMGINYFVLGSFEREMRPELAQEIQQRITQGDTTFEIILVETRGRSDIYVLRINHPDD